MLKKHQKLMASLVILQMVLSSVGFTRPTMAASLTDAYDRLSESNINDAATHNVTFTTHVGLVATDYIDVKLPAAFGTINNDADITCPGGFTASRQDGNRTARCTAGGNHPATTTNITIRNVNNPATEGSRLIEIYTRNASAVVIESVHVLVAIINNVLVTANVASALTFIISPLATNTPINGAFTTNTSATSSLAFGVLPVATSTILGQQLRVTTNSDNGYVVTVEQDQNLTSLGGSDIDSFINGTTSAPTVAGNAWEAPATLLDQEWTYGHFGFSSEDQTLSAGDTFGDNLWKGFVGTTTVPVMYHEGPSDGNTQHKGETKIAYRIEISALQEAGDYTNVLTYIATPTF